MSRLLLSGSATVIDLSRPYRARPRCGAVVVVVPLFGSLRPAFLDPEDFDRLMSQDVSELWTFRSNRLVTTRIGHCSPPVYGVVARLILSAPAGMRARYRNGKTRDLRRSNLFLDPSAVGRLSADDLLRRAGQL